MTHVGFDTQSFSAALASRYRLGQVLGRGGMATVYQADDVRHQRHVAIKVLHPELAAVIGGERFLTEIRTTATLQHPHILGLLDSGDAGGVLYYVMPLVEGESLRDRLRREGQLPVDDALRLAREVAAALDYAHRHGVVHRDIKPENILLHDGNALVSDFGIALAVSSAGGERLTQTGVSLGTPQYMAPEQAMAERTIDARADVYALGAVTYEMLVGEAPFTGPTTQAIISRAMTETPRSLTTQRHSVPASVEAAVFRALEKLPADRFRTASEFAAALDAPAPPVATREPPPLRRVVVLATEVTVVVAAALGGWLAAHRGGAGVAQTPPSRLALVVPHLGGSGPMEQQRQIALTPDGSAVVYVASDSAGRGKLVRQSLADMEATAIPGMREGLADPSISPDGRSLFVIAAGERVGYRYPIDGGTALPIPMPGGFAEFAEWDARGTLWFTPSAGGSIWKLARNDSTSHVVAGSSDLRFQQMLPDGRHALVMQNSNVTFGPAAVFDVETGRVTPLKLEALTEVKYAAGYLVFVLADGTLQAAPFDASSARVTGPATTIGTSVSTTGTGIAQFTTAPNGTVAWIVEEPPSLVLVSRDGRAHPALGARHNFHFPQFSPDGSRVSVDLVSESGRDVWILSLADGTLSRATFAGDGHDATWTPDGRFITYLSLRGGAARIYRKRWSGGDSAEALFGSPGLAFTGRWLRDGSALVSVVNDLRQGSGPDIALIANGGRGPAQPVVSSRFVEAYPAVAPDGRWVAFTSDQSGREEVYARPLGREGDQVQISLDGGSEAVWAPDGREIFYRSPGTSGQAKLMSASVTMGSTLSVTARRALFPVSDMLTTQPHADYDISPDGRTFAMVRRSPPTTIMVLQNLPAFMKRNVP